MNQAAKKRALLTLISYFSDICLIAILFFCGSWFIITNRISVGAFVTVVTLSESIRESFELFDRGISTVRESEAYAARINELLDLPAESSKASDPHSSSNKETSVFSSEDPVIQVHDLCFSYEKNNPILRHIDLSIKKSPWVGIIGKSGCGNSTLVNILCGLYPDYQGKVELFGHSLSESCLDTLRKKIAVVSQDPHLFCGTIGENISYGNDKATVEQLHTAIAGARLEDLILSSAQGINTPIGDNGSKLSGGQRQRIAIARAFIKDADLIILDEASSALDYKTELEIQDTLEAAFRDKTVLIIAHRFSSIKNADYIYCMDEGRIVEQGNKETLLNSDSRLRQMAIRQEGIRQ